ncbi:uncharacterized protein LOC143565679 isoform X2 [Bidens hawaiensis]|uniref:uncharacterized protein LOC143565679 isoform X1 n=1 Tax=Bidens hawaiensis TaxID=980011 RepID=UPI00404A8A18
MSEETSTGASLKEAIFTQQQLLQKLYNELEVEREFSATAASEALAMILRLQGEKAAVKMESEHYKRLAEEKIYHAEESMEIFEELIHQKEMEIANLDYQVQAYRYKLSSLGLEDSGLHETKFPESLLQIGEKETSPESLLRRNSAPPKLFKMAYLKRINLERNRSVSPESDIERSDESHHNLDSDKQTYWEQIRKLDKIVEEMTKESENGQKQQKSTDEMVLDACNLSVLDVFEVPETNENLDIGKSILEDENKIEKVSTFIEDQDSIKSFEKTLFLNKKDNIVVDCRMAVNVVEGEGSSQQVSTSEITEGDANVRSREPVIIRGREDEMLKLLYEINRKLDCIQAANENGKIEEAKPSSNYDLPMLQLQEAMLHFWM